MRKQHLEMWKLNHERLKSQREYHLELLKLYYEEWKFRQENLWKRIIQFVVIIFFTSTLPFTIRVFGDVPLPQIDHIVFPIAGVLLTAFFVFFCFAESTRINTVDSKIKLIIKNNFPEEYAKNGLEPLIQKRESREHTGILHCRMAIWVPIVIAVIELIIAGVMIALIRGWIA